MISASAIFCIVNALELIQIPSNKSIDVVFLVSGVRSRLVGAGVDSALLAFANNPVLLGGELPEGHDFCQVVVAAFLGFFVDQPPNADGSFLRAGGAKTCADAVVAA